MSHSRWSEGAGGATLAFGEHTAYGNSTYREISGPTGHLARCEDFEGHSMRALWRVDYDGITRYWIYSYETPIAYWQPAAAGDTDDVPTLAVNEYRYSNYTTRQQSLAEAWTASSSNKDNICIVVYADHEALVRSV